MRLPREDDQASPKNYRSVPKEEINEAANQIYKKPERIIDKERRGRIDDDRLNNIIGLLLGKFKISMEENDRRLLGLLLSLDKVDKNHLKVLFQVSVKRENFKAYLAVNHVTDELRAFDESIKGSE